MHRVLFINPFGIGDCLFTTPLVRAIKKTWPDSFLGFWCNERVAELLKPNPDIDVVWGLSRGDIKRKYGNFSFRAFKSWANLYKEIKKGRFDISLDFSLDSRYGFMAELAGIRERIGFDYKGRGRLLKRKIEISGYNDKHIVEYYLQLLEFLNIKSQDPRLELFISGESASWAENFLKKEVSGKPERFFGICPGAGESWGKDAGFKRLEPGKFSDVCNKVIDKFKFKVLIFGNRQDERACDEVYSGIKNKSSVLKIYPDFTLSQFSALLARCNLLLTNDGGPLHMAVALGIKTVSIFGPVSEIVYGPYPASENHIVIKAKVECRPCYRNFRFSKCEQGKQCLSDIKSEDIFLTIERLL